MSEKVNCEYSKTIMEEPVCNAFDVNRYGEIICSKDNCIILKLKEQLQAKEKECERLRKQYNYCACGSCRGREDYRNMARHYENAITVAHTLRQDCQYFKTQLEYFKDLLVESENELRIKEHECEQLKLALQASDIAKAIISSAEINFPIVKKLSTALDEIKKLAKEIADTKEWVNCTYNSVRAEQILDIINKAKGNKQ